MFVLSNLGIGGSERKIVRLANRLKDDGVHVTLACLNGPYTIEASIRRDVTVHETRAQGQVFVRRSLAPAADPAARAAGHRARA